MKQTDSHSRQINNELLLRDANEKSKQIIKEHTPKNEVVNLVIDFYCECSSLACQSRVPLNIAAFEKLHATQAHFIIATATKVLLSKESSYVK